MAYTEKTAGSPKHKAGGPNSQFTKKGKKKAKVNSVNDELHNPFDDGRTPTGASQTTGP